MAKFLILSEGGDGVGLAQRLKQEGHDARIWIRDPAVGSMGHGIVDHADEYTFGQTVVADCTGSGIILDKFRDADIPIFGGSSFHDRLESDREYAESVLRDSGISVPDSQRVDSWDAADSLIKKLGKSTGRVVLKPEGHLAGILPSYVAYDLDDAHKTLECWKLQVAGENVSILIQEYIEGIAISTEGWFNGSEWIPGMFNHTIERKQFLNDDLGPSGGCTGNIVWKCDWTDPLVKNGLLKITPILERHRYVGPIDINTVVGRSGNYALEFTPRCGYDAFPTLLLGLCEFDFGAFIEDLARGYDSEATLMDGFAAGVRLSIPPWPTEDHPTGKHIPIEGMDQENWEYFYPYDVQLNDKDELESSGGYGILGVMVCNGETIGEAFAKSYYSLSTLRVKDKQYRTDLAQVCLRDYRQLYQDDLGWYGVDLDKTLARYRKGQGSIGEPLAPMVARVKRLIGRGKEVRIMTARATGDDRHGNIVEIHEWLKENIGIPIEVTATKDYEMVELFDDRATEVEPNTGELVS